jgi:hypothetical protein
MAVTDTSACCLLHVQEHEHVSSFSTHYWQRPKNQLTLLGTYGRGAKLAYFDLDEYLVLPGGANVGDATCLGKSLLDAGDAADIGSWTFIRFQAKTCADRDSDMPCWQAGASVTSRQDIELLHDVCPMSTSHGKQIMVADMVDSIGVHFTESQRFKGNTPIDASCGYLLHFYSLLEGRRAGVTGTLRKLPPVAWTVDSSFGGRHLHWPEGLVPLTYETCKTKVAARMDALIAYKHTYQARHGKLPVIGKPRAQHAAPQTGHAAQSSRARHPKVTHT